MTMPPLPPAEMVLEALRQTVLPAAGGAALVMGLFLVLGRWAAALGSAVAVVVGFAWSNYTFDAVTWENTGRLIPWKPDRYVWHLLPRAALVLMGIGLVSRWTGLLAARSLPNRNWWVSNFLVWVPRWAAVVVVSAWLVPTQVQDQAWVRPALAATMLVSWLALDGVSRAGCGGEVAAYLAAIFLAAGTILLLHNWPNAMNLAVTVGCALFGVAVAAGAARGDASGAIPAAVGFLPGLLLSGRIQAESKVPLVCFWLVALAPLVLTPFLIPRLARLNRWIAVLIRALLVFAPLAVAAAIALQHEQMPWVEEE